MLSHRMTGTPIYEVWRNIKRRCLNPDHKVYKYYGGRGITIYPAWINDFQAFYDYVSTLEHFGEKGYSLDRIDVNGNYAPGNLRWVKRATQNRNQRRNIYVDYNGVNMLLIDVAKIIGVDYVTLLYRYHKGWRDDKLFRPVRKVLPKSDLIVIDNNQALTTSLKIAEYFGKRHDRVLRAIEKELANLRIAAEKNPSDPNFGEAKINSAFIKGEYKDLQGKPRPMYYLNQTGFSQVILGFTGVKASELRWRYIAEFERMKAALKAQNQI